MKRYRAILHPVSNFATPLRGETLFGQLCWSIRHLWGNDRLVELLSDYETKPFLIVSDPFAPGYLPKPTLPAKMLGESVEKKKEYRKRIWLKPEDLRAGRYEKARTDEEAGNEDVLAVQVHNSLDYRSFRTGEEAFAPYASSEWALSDKEIYLAVDEARFGSDELLAALRHVGEYGYGKKSSIGKGRFTVEGLVEVAMPQNGRRFMTLSAASFEGLDADRCWYDIHTQFGKHGGAKAKPKAFKRPVLLAKGGAVVEYEKPRTISFLGKALTNVSPMHPETVMQGYALTVAIEEGT